MTSLRAALGKPVIDRETAEQIGDAHFFAVVAKDRRVSSLVVSQGRKTLVVGWADIQSIGPDAVIVNASHEPSSDEDRLVSGSTNPLDKRVLSDRGNEVGQATDAEVDDSGSIESLQVGDAQIDGGRLRGIGSYSVVIEAEPGEA
jgi:sporulation protein YlmC with PRC-barrel domain